MGFMDKVKEQAASAASAAKDAAAKGQAKVGEMQAKRGADGVLRQLGLAAYLQTRIAHRRRPTPTSRSTSRPSRPTRRERRTECLRGHPELTDS